MTGLEALNNFNIESRSFQKTSEIKFQTSEIQYLLNRGQDEVFQKYYDEFEKSEYKRFALDELITPVILANPADLSVNQAGAKTNGLIWKMPSNLYYIVEENGTTDSDDNFIRIKPIKRDYYSINLDNPLKRPDVDLAWRLDHKPYPGEDLKRRETITADGITLIYYNITYIKRPAEIDVTDNTTELELGYRALKEVISEAVKMAYAVDKDRLGYEISQAEKMDKNKN